jgi:translation initiation factor IF-2
MSKNNSFDKDKKLPNKKTDELDNKISNILKKDTTSMFNMFKSNSLDNFKVDNPPKKNFSMEKITMTSHKPTNDFKTNDLKKKPNAYNNSVEKIINKKPYENPAFNNSVRNFNKNFNNGPRPDHKKVEKVVEQDYNKILNKFISKKPEESQNSYKEEYSAILGSMYKDDNLNKDKNRIQNIIKAIQEKTEITPVKEEVIVEDKKGLPMVKTFETPEYFPRRSPKKPTKRAPLVFPLLNIEKSLKFKDLAFKLNITEKNLFFLLKKNQLETLSKQFEINIDELLLICEALEIPYKVLDNFDTYINKIHDYKKTLSGSPIIAIVGHIDHGKTSLIEKLTEKKLCNSESGNITQKISSYSIKYKDRYIRLIDTPGHSVFKNARNLAIEICDFVILIVSAPEGIQPQTVDSIKFLQEHNIPFITVITKIDLNKKYHEIYNKLMQYNIIPTNMGGENDVLAVSSKTGENIDGLLDHIVNMSDLYNLTSDIESDGWGYVLESWKGKMGIKASILLKNGKISAGDEIFFNNNTSLKIKNIFVNNEKVNESNLYNTIEIEGLSDYINSNEKFWIINDKKKLKEAEDLWVKQKNINTVEPIFIKEKKKKVRKQHRFTNIKNMPMTAIEEKVEVVEDKVMKILIVTRSYNDIAAIKECLNTLKENNKIGEYKILTTLLGIPNSLDIDMLAYHKGCLIAFNTPLPLTLVSEIKNKNIPLFYSDVIYNIVNELEEYYNNQFNSEDVLEECGEAEIVAIFKIQKKFIAGCVVRKGAIIRNQKGQLLRDGKILAEGKIESLKHEANDIKEAKNNQECGIYIPDITEKYQLKDRIVCWRTKRIVKTQDGKIISEKYI